MAVKDEWSLDDGRITFAARDGSVTQEVDPVCGQQVPPEASQQATFRGEIYRFCSPSCRQRFIEAPERYAKPAARAEE